MRTGLFISYLLIEMVDIKKSFKYRHFVFLKIIEIKIACVVGHFSLLITAQEKEFVGLKLA